MNKSRSFGIKINLDLNPGFNISYLCNFGKATNPSRALVFCKVEEIMYILHRIDVKIKYTTQVKYLVHKNTQCLMNIVIFIIKQFHQHLEII